MFGIYLGFGAWNLRFKIYILYDFLNTCLIMKKPYIIGIDLGATNIKVGLIKNRRIIYKKVVPTRDFPSKKELISALVENINNIPVEKKQILAVGLGVPGLVDFKRGFIHYLPNIKGWHNVYLAKELSRKTGFPVFVDNDANLMSLAEARIGAAKGKKDVIGITLGTGVGGGLILEGRLYRGANFAAGEVGHIPLNESGPKCNCSGFACLERYIGNTYILEEVKRSLGREVSLEDSSRLAQKGNYKAIKIWKNIANHLGVALASLVNILDPEVIVMGGGVANAGEIIFDQVRKTIKQRAMKPQGSRVKVVKAKLSNDAGMLGAALLAEEESIGCK